LLTSVQILFRCFGWIQIGPDGPKVGAAGSHRLQKNLRVITLEIQYLIGLCFLC
jgi:hypothetical protein